MDTIQDFEDMLLLLDDHNVRYLIVGGLAFIYHAKPRYTKDIDLWVDPNPENLKRANLALSEFGSPTVFESDDIEQIIQIGIAPNRIDLLLKAPPVGFDRAWENRIEGQYGTAPAYWINLDDLLLIKEAIDNPRHQDDARILRQVKESRRNHS